MLNSAIDIIQPPPASAKASAVSAGMRLSEATAVPMPIASSAARTAPSLPNFAAHVADIERAEDCADAEGAEHQRRRSLQSPPSTSRTSSGISAKIEPPSAPVSVQRSITVRIGGEWTM